MANEIIAECWLGKKYQVVLNMDYGTVRAYKEATRSSGWVFITQFHWSAGDHALRTSMLPEAVRVELQWRLAQQAMTKKPMCNW
jgi:hypothetical protein